MLNAVNDYFNFAVNIFRFSTGMYCCCINDTRNIVKNIKIILPVCNLVVWFYVSLILFGSTFRKYLSVFLEVFFIRLTLSKTQVCGLMQIFPSLNMFRRLVKLASSRWVTFIE